MREDVGRKLDMAGRVLVFARANQPAEPGHQAATTLFEGRLLLADTLLDRQANGQLTAKAAGLPSNSAGGLVSITPTLAIEAS